MVDVLGETLIFITDVPALPEDGVISIQLLDVDEVHEASALTVTSTIPAVLLNVRVSVDAVIEAGAWRTIMFEEAFLFPM